MTVTLSLVCDRCRRQAEVRADDPNRWGWLVEADRSLCPACIKRTVRRP